MIGIISDTHDNVENIQKAVKIFIEKEVDFVVHCGDIIAPATVRFFKGLKVKFILGNCDGDVEMIKQMIEYIDGEFLGEMGEFEYKQKKFCVYHGKDQNKLSKLCHSGKYDYVLHGHTHIKRDERIGKTRVINPGAHYYGSENTIAFLDIASDRVEFIKI